ncbi:RepB family plasmid replication initiator protein [Enterococcus faecium]|uniref:replication initiation protein n=1 Tax=Enterococcus faecium TaxID=1352 RepID=UPI00032F2163|nr:replication initiation protein [Enterococcus faecium]EMF0115678.1 replication initiation protein [Enterococcus hirae]EGP5140782.1 RepB family plasmid replication initiator protein [Enterococcus faecium]EGP5338622.1 RepB family plasmid replication initiator protein [Enterococcus faecium]EGP5559471.1 RepB family plasmid replication initiator protein [Enterococcus faecium]EGP5747292.1 RepB family plasmid replication initiator protein [Enterococcus faecium]
MANEIVKYENRLNHIPLRKFNSREMNLFFSIASRVREKGTDEITFSFHDLKKLSGYTERGEQFIKDLSSTYDKLLSINAWNDDGNTLTKFVAFTKYSIIRDKQLVIISVNPEFKGLFNQLKNWTRFNLEQFTNLDSTYSKTMFRLLKQYRTQGWAEFSKETFFDLLDIPKSYWNSPSNIDKFILKPIKEELTPLFKGLTIRKKYGKGRGKPVIGYRFTWKAEINHADDFSKGKQEDLRMKLFNIEHNGELTQKEKWRAKDRILNLPLGTHEADFKKQQQTEKEEAEKQANSNELKQDLLENLQNLFD